MVQIELDINTIISITHAEEDGRFKVNYEYRNGNRTYLLKQDLLREYLQTNRKEAE